MKPILFASALAVALLSPVAAEAQDTAAAVPADNPALAALPPAERAIHQELIAFRIGIQAAFNKMGESGKPEDMAALLEFAHPDAIFTAMTGESVRGNAELIEYFKRDFTTPDHALKRMQSRFEADHLSILLRPDVATNRGTVHSTFDFTDGSKLAVDSRWTATMVKQDGRWKVAAFQFAPSIFDTPVTNAYRAWIYKAAAIAGVIALALGIFVGRRMRKARAA
jgi:ketosteroid isomerase-like protein